MKKFILLITVICFMLSGCSKKNSKITTYVFQGQNDLWNVELKITAKEEFREKNGGTTYKIDSSEVLTATYQKDLSDLSSVKKIVISYKSSTGSCVLEEDYSQAPPTDTVFTISSKSSGGALELPDEVIEVNITLDDTTQTIELKNES